MRDPAHWRRIRDAKARAAFAAKLMGRAHGDEDELDEARLSLGDTIHQGSCVCAPGPCGCGATLE